EPRVAAQIVGHALDRGRDAARRQRRIDSAHGVHAGGGDGSGSAGIVGGGGGGAAGSDAGIVDAGRVGAAGDEASAIGVRPGGGGSTCKRGDQQTHEDDGDRIHDVRLPHWVLEGAPSAVGLDGGAGSGWENGMRLALVALADAKAPAGTERPSCQLENSTWWRNCNGSLAKTARDIRGSLSSAPIQICTNTPWLA